uniref:Uncharacterized protein n=1 Tax=Anguilla anguilla TaxID=7936 RepID=A0A0E9TRS0_ANGAN
MVFTGSTEKQSCIVYNKLRVTTRKPEESHWVHYCGWQIFIAS